MERRPAAIILERSIATLDRTIEITETLLQEYMNARRKLKEELSQLTPTEAVEAFKRASQELKAIKDDDKYK